MKAPKRSNRKPRRRIAVRTVADGPCSIGELAVKLKVTQRAIRFYETRGLIAPARNGAQRVYSADDETRMRLILRTKNLGFSLEDIAKHLRLYDAEPSSAAAINVRLLSIDEAIELLDGKLADLQAVITDLRKIRARCVSGLRRGR